MRVITVRDGNAFDFRGRHTREADRTNDNGCGTISIFKQTAHRLRYIIGGLRLGLTRLQFFRLNRRRVLIISVCQGCIRRQSWRGDECRLVNDTEINSVCFTGIIAYRDRQGKAATDKFRQPRQTFHQSSRTASIDQRMNARALIRFHGEQITKRPTNGECVCITRITVRHLDYAEGKLDRVVFVTRLNGQACLAPLHVY